MNQSIAAHATVIIRRAKGHDAAALAQIGEQTFRESYTHLTRPGDLEMYLKGAFGPDIQAAEIEDPRVCYLVAEAEGATIGYVKLTDEPAPPCVTGPNPVKLSRIYVLNDWKQRGIGSLLMKAALMKAKSQGFHTIWLTVWEINERASKFYGMWSFHDVGEAEFQLGETVNRDRVFARPIES